jgi:UDP-N-acetylmuramoyl-tripeptide--D-alanyl-D-alanine ligase
LAGYIAEAARLAGAEIALACNDHGEAQYALRSILRKGDTVLVKGSRGMHMEAILERLR